MVRRMDITALGFTLLSIAGLAHLGTIAVVTARLRRPTRRPQLDLPPQVTLIRPVCGLENFIEEDLETSFKLSYPRLELIFCVESPTDPVVPIVRRLIDAYPPVNARLLVGRDTIGANPKLNNIVKGWNAATSDWIIISDSNALLPTDYIESLLVRWRPNTGVVSSATIVTAPEGFAAEIECAFLNSYQARWVLAADSLGLGFALGKTLMWRRETLRRAGGLQALAAETAEDIASTKALRGTKLRPRLAQRPVAQPIGRRMFGEVWRRQVRWAQLRRVGLRASYLPEVLSGGAAPFAIAGALTLAGAIPPVALGALFLAWYGLEAALSIAVRWPMSWRMPLALVARDLLMPAMWVRGWFGKRFEWRGNIMTIQASRERRPREAAEAEPS